MQTDPKKLVAFWLPHRVAGSALLVPIGVLASVYCVHECARCFMTVIYEIRLGVRPNIWLPVTELAAMTVLAIASIDFTLHHAKIVHDWWGADQTRKNKCP